MIKKIFVSLFILTVCFSSTRLAAEVSAPITLTESDATTGDQVIYIRNNQQIIIKLQGQIHYSNVYSSGSGNERGRYWKFAGSSTPNVLLLINENTTSKADNTIFSGNNTIEIQSEVSWKTSPTYQSWDFLAQEPDETILTFNNYYYSNATTQNLDDASRWKNPLKTIQFRIRVIHDTQVTEGSARNN